MLTVALIDARMTATRLPRRVLADLAGWPVLYRVIERARAATRVDEAVVTTSCEPVDDPIAHFCDEFRVPCFRGRADDTLGRCVAVARALRADVIVYLAANGPLLDPWVIDEVVRAFHRERSDYASNVLERTYPYGLDVEVFSAAALETAAAEAEEAHARRSVAAHFIAHPERFRLHSVRHPRDLSAFRWIVEDPGDLAFVRGVYDGCGPAPCPLDALVTWMETAPATRSLQVARAGVSCDP